jgi:hypothetical protein
LTESGKVFVPAYDDSRPASDRTGKNHSIFPVTHSLFRNITRIDDLSSRNQIVKYLLNCVSGSDQVWLKPGLTEFTFQFFENTV